MRWVKGEGFFGDCKRQWQENDDGTQREADYLQEEVMMKLGWSWVGWPR